MNRLSYTLRSIILPLLATMTFAACTIIDNDLRDLPDKPGYKEIVHLENEEGTIDYQYNPNTKIIDASYQCYISKVDYANHALYLFDYIPDDLLPETGDVLAAEKSEKLEWGLSHNVRDVKREGSFYVVTIEQAALDEVFKHLVVDCDTYFALSSGEAYTEDDHIEEGASDSTTLARSWVKIGRQEGEAAMTRAGEEEDEAGKNDPEHERWQHGGEMKTVTINVFKLWNVSDIASSLGIVESKLPNAYTLTGSITSNGGEGALSANFDATAKLIAKLTPIVKVRNYINIDEKKFDVHLKLGGNFSLEMGFAGSLYLKFDIWKYFNLPSLPAVQIGAALAGLPLFYETGFSLVFDVTLSGSMARTWKKNFAITVGARYNIPNQDNGMYAIKDNPDATSIIDEEWNVESDKELSFSGGLTFSIVPDLYFGSPTEAPRLGLKYSPSIGIRFTIGATTDKTTVGESTIRLYVPVRFADVYAYVKFWKNLEFSYNIGDAIAKAINGEDYTAEAVLWENTWKLFPTVDNVGLLCTNFDKVSETPKFELDFDVENMGINATSRKNLRPMVEIYDDSGNKILEKKDFDFCDKNSSGKHFEWKFQNANIKRDKKYTAHINWMKRNEYGEGRLYYKKYDFTTYTPSCYIFNHDITGQRVKYKQLAADSYKNGVVAYPYHPDKTKCKGYQWDFCTYVMINNYNKISSWGFYVGSVGKSKFTINETPKYPAAKIYFASSSKKWSSKNEKTYKLYTWVKSKETENVWPEGYTLKLSFDESKNDPKFSGKKDKEGYDIPYVRDDAWNFIYGFKKAKEAFNTYDVNKDFSYARKMTIDDDYISFDNLPVYVIDLDEIDDEAENEE